MIQKSTKGKKTRESLLEEIHAEDENPKLVFFVTGEDQLAQTARMAAQYFPKSMTMGIESCYTYDNGAVVENETYFLAVSQKDELLEVAGGILTDLRKAPISRILQVRRQLQAVHSGNQDTVCIEFCTNEEEKLVTTLNAALEGSGVTLLGATVFHSDLLSKPRVNLKVAFNGEVYTDACIYLFLCNKLGSIRLYRENIYQQAPNAPMHLATKVDLETKGLCELDGRPAAMVYSEEAGVPLEQVVDNVMQAPLGRAVGDEVFIASMRTRGEDGTLYNFKSVNRNDAIYILHLGDYKKVDHDLYAKMREENPSMRFVFSVECLYRYMLYKRDGYLEAYGRARDAAMGQSFGIFGASEQMGEQSVNQTALYAVFSDERK